MPHAFDGLKESAENLSSELSIFQVLTNNQSLCLLWEIGYFLWDFWNNSLFANIRASF